MIKLVELDKEEKEELYMLKANYRDNIKLYRKQLLCKGSFGPYLATSPRSF